MILAPLLVLACATSDFGLTPVVEDPVLDAVAWERVAVPDQGSAIEAAVDPESDLRLETFSVGTGAVSERQDFLFVIDDSQSMRRVRDQVVSGLRSLEQADVFPDRARIAVMNMTPADPERPRRPHPLARRDRQLKGHPGFVHLVSDARLQAWSEGALIGCDRWFAPGEQTADGRACFGAHAALSMGRYRVEDGVVALAQLLERRGDKGLFRQGSVANVVFVSDTQPPGYVPDRDDDERWQAFDDLAALRPDWAGLQALVGQHHDLAALRIHAIAPETSCSEDWEGLETTYQDLAVASGGVVADSCGVSDYAAVVRAIQETGAVQTDPILVLGTDPVEVVRVLVDGDEVPWTGSGAQLRVLDAVGTQAQVIYRTR